MSAQGEADGSDSEPSRNPGNESQLKSITPKGWPYVSLG